MKMYLISGESYRQINEKINSIIKSSTNISTFDLSCNTIEEVLIEAGYLSMFQEEKYIIIKNATFFGTVKISESDTEMLLKYFEHPNDLSILIFICNEKIDMRKKIAKVIKEKYEIIQIPPLKYYEIENRIAETFKKNNYKIDQESVKHIVANSLNNFDISMNEAEKIMLYYNSPCTISYQDVISITSKSINSNNFLFVDSVVDGDLKKSLELYQDLKIMKVDPTVLISLLARDYRIILEVKILQENGKREYEIMNTVGLLDWQLEKYLKKVFPYKKQEIENILVNLANIDLDIKSGKKDKFIALELLILDLCE